MFGPALYTKMFRGRYNPEKGLDGSSYCVFREPLTEPVIKERIYGDEEKVVLELRYGDDDFSGALRIRQEGTNVVLEETEDAKFTTWLGGREIKYIGHLIIFAVQFKIEVLSDRVSRSEGILKDLEDSLDNSIDNSGTYDLLDFRRRFAEDGDMIISVKEILTRIDKGYFSAQMQNAYVLQGRAQTDFDFLDERYELLRETVLKDFDTYTSIVNNNINRNVRLLSIVSIFAVVLNFMFGGLILAHPLVGVLGGLAVAGVSLCSVGMYHINRRKPMLDDPSAEFFRAYIAEESKDKGGKKLLSARKDSSRRQS